MNARIAAFALFVAAPLAASASGSQVDCNAPRGVAERRACEAAQQGIEPLRRIAHATRHMHAIYPQDFAAVALEAERRAGRLAADAARPAGDKVAAAK